MNPFGLLAQGKSANAAQAGSIIGLTVRGTVADVFGEETAKKYAFNMVVASKRAILLNIWHIQTLMVL